MIQAIAGAIYMRAAHVDPQTFLDMQVPTVVEVFQALETPDDAPSHMPGLVAPPRPEDRKLEGKLEEKLDAPKDVARDAGEKLGRGEPDPVPKRRGLLCFCCVAPPEAL